MLRFIFGVTFPFILGGAFAFVLNVPMNFIQRHLFLKKVTEKSRFLKKASRPFSMIAVILLVIGVVALVMLVLQQIEGNFIYPHVVGNSVGLPSIWVLAAVSLGGSLMGVVGMLIFIPIVSVVYALFRKAVYPLVFFIGYKKINFRGRQTC